MYYQLWGIQAGNRIADFKSEAEALAMVRDLLDVGWTADELALGALEERDDPIGLVIPPTLSGTALAERACAGRSGADSFRAPGRSRA